MDAAREVFVEKGFTKASMSEIAQRAGVAHGTTYLYFKSKDALALSLADELNDQFLQIALPLLLNGNAKEGIRRLVREFFELCQSEQRTLQILYVSLGVARVETLRAQEEGKPDIQAMYIQALVQQMEAGQLQYYADPQSLFMLLIGVFNWVALHAFAFTLLPAEQLQSLEVTLIQMLERALLP